MKIIVTHASPDWDAITSVWIIKRFLPTWENAKVMLVPAGERIKKSSIVLPDNELSHAVEKIGEDEVIHVDTGMGPLDHHQTNDLQVSAASRTWDFVKTQHTGGEKWLLRADAIGRIINVVVSIDHFQEVYWENPFSDHYEFSLLGVLEGLKYQKPGDDDFYIVFGMECLDALVYNFENRAWAEKEIKEKGIIFETRFGKAIAIETMNDTVLKLAQKTGYTIVIRKDPRSGFVRIKTAPERAGILKKTSPDFTLITEQFRKMDPDATWYLHISKKMLLNGTTKNPNMVPTKLTLKQIINVVKAI
ncbi:MAG TPA: DHH family phosphoesterase [Patescibacteria group bacterium]|nr:DHH family phosphoesterase [Patescibacteria group bacterium]